jgi:hypothetical protein
MAQMAGSKKIRHARFLAFFYEKEDDGRIKLR